VSHRFRIAMILGCIAAGSSITGVHARSQSATAITAHRALALCGHSHMHFHATIQGYVRTGSFTRRASFSAGLFDSNRVPQTAGTGLQFTRYHGLRLVLPYTLVRHKPSILVSGARLTVYGVVVCAGARTTVDVTHVVSVSH
jgi:hypothetical protein